MAQRLSFDERARVEAMSAAGVSVAAAARCLGRHRSTVYRELRRGRRGGAYDAGAAQAAAAVGAARPKIPVLAADPELAASVRELLKEGWSPHAIRAGLRAEGLCALSVPKIRGKSSACRRNRTQRSQNPRKESHSAGCTIRGFGSGWHIVAVTWAVRTSFWMGADRTLSVVRHSDTPGYPTAWTRRATVSVMTTGALCGP